MPESLPFAHINVAIAFCFGTVAGIKRYKILKVIQKQPILIAEVEMMPKENDTSPKVPPLPCTPPTFLTDLCLPLCLQQVLLRHVLVSEGSGRFLTHMLFPRAVTLPHKVILLC